MRKNEGTTNVRLKLELRDFAIKMDVLLQEARRLCRESEPECLSASAAGALDGIEKNNDFLLAITDDRPPGPFVVRVEIPGADEPVRLEAAWNDDVKAYRLTNVPIGLAVVARAIDVALVDRHWRHSLSVSWSAIPSELEHLVEFSPPSCQQHHGYTGSTEDWLDQGTETPQEAEED